uniref:Tyrosine specific protein phosphatases domain-containing protein n=1 Tax=Oncorhynchus mykiss TaxID=8022 RepID=A0A8K9Y132_ONCMY
MRGIEFRKRVVKQGIYPGGSTTTITRSAPELLALEIRQLPTTTSPLIQRCYVNAQSNLVDGVSCHPVGHLIEVTCRMDEMKHITDLCFVFTSIYYSPMSSLLTSCPRQLDQVTLKLKEELGVTMLVNFQKEGDVVNIFSGYYRDPGQDMTPETMIHLYRDCRLRLWTADVMRILPQNVFLLHGLLENGHTVYVHCKADVGRSTTVVCLLMFVLGWSKRKEHYFETLVNAMGDFMRTSVCYLET